MHLIRFNFEPHLKQRLDLIFKQIQKQQIFDEFLIFLIMEQIEKISIKPFHTFTTINQSTKSKWLIFNSPLHRKGTCL